MSLRRLWVLAPLVGMSLAAPSLMLGLHAIDDPMHRRLVLGRLQGQGGADPWYDLFSLVGNDPESAEAERVGLRRPWYAYDGLSVRFLRPIAAVTHYVDHILWPDATWLMHLHSVLWYGIACACIALLGQRVNADPRVAWVGAFIYALDEAHAEPAAWIANRNGLIATVFASVALLLHHEGCRSSAIRPRVLALLFLGTALLSAEAAVGVLAFFFAHALWVDQRGLRARMASLLPVVCVTVGWFLLHRAMGYGARGSGFYLDPLADGRALLAAAPERALYLLRSQVAGMWTLADELPDVVLAPVRFAGEWVLLPALLVWSLLRVQRDRVLAFWLSGAIISMLPLLSVPPHERLLVISGIGWSMAFGSMAVAAWDRWSSLRGPGRLLPALALVLLAVVHGMFAPLAFVLEARSFGDGELDPALAAPVLDLRKGLEQAHVVVLNAPNQLHGAMIPLERARRGLPVARYHSVLGSTPHRVEVTRIDERTLDLSSPFGYLEDVFAAFWRSPSRPLPRRQPIRVHDYSAEVLWSIVDGRPQRIRFRFDRPLGDSGYRFIIWRGSAYEVFGFAPIGIHKSIPAVYDARPISTFP